MRALPALLLGAAAYAAFLVAGLPASVVASRLPAGLPIAIERIEGTVWQGRASARLALRQGPLAIEDLAWRFLPSRLALGRAAFEVTGRVSGIAVRAEASRGIGEWQLRELKASGEAKAVAALHPLAATWDPAGTLEVDAALLTVANSQVSGAATAEWREAGLAISPVRPLGHWRAEVQAAGGPATVKVTTLSGPLRFAGQGTLSTEGRLAFAGEARADPGRDGDLAAVLNLLGPRRADGAHAIDVR